MTVFQQLKGNVEVLRFEVNGDQVVNEEVPDFLARSIENVKQQQRLTIEEYLLGFCNSTANLLALERSGSGIVLAEAEI